MLARLLLIGLVFQTSLSFAQDSTAVEPISELEKRNGFKDIKLGMVVDSLKGIKFKKDIKENDEFEAKVYEVENPAFMKIGEVDVKWIEVKAYKSLIYEIIVVTEKDTRLMKALESIYGLAEYDMKRETYFWKAKPLILKFRAHGRNQLEMNYSSNIVRAKMKADKAKKVEAIADDF